MSWFLWLVTLNPLVLLPALPGLALSIGARVHVLRAYRRAREATGSRGKLIAEEILRLQHVSEVNIIQEDGPLGDFFDGGTQTLRLSQRVYDGPCLAAIAIAACEAGYAAESDVKQWIRARLHSLIRLGSFSAWMIVATGLLFQWTEVLVAGFLAISAFVFMALVIVPTERSVARRIGELIEKMPLFSREQAAQIIEVMNANAWSLVAIPLTTRRCRPPKSTSSSAEATAS